MHSAVRGAAAFHHVVLAVEEIGRSSPDKTRTAENRRRARTSVAVHSHPLPSRSATPNALLPCRKAPTGVGSQLSKIEVAESAIGGFVAPRIRPLRSSRRAVSRAMPLRFRGQRFPRPSRISAGFRVTHVHGPVERQRNILQTWSGTAIRRRPDSRRRDAKCCASSSTSSRLHATRPAFS